MALSVRPSVTKLTVGFNCHFWIIFLLNFQIILLKNDKTAMMMSNSSGQARIWLSLPLLYLDFVNFWFSDKVSEGPTNVQLNTHQVFVCASLNVLHICNQRVLYLVHS